MILKRWYWRFSCLVRPCVCDLSLHSIYIFYLLALFHIITNGHVLLMFTQQCSLTILIIYNVFFAHLTLVSWSGICISCYVTCFPIHCLITNLYCIIYISKIKYCLKLMFCIAFLLYIYICVYYFQIFTDHHRIYILICPIIKYHLIFT